MTLGSFLNLRPADTGIAGLSILAAGQSAGFDTSISNEVFLVEGYNITAGGSRFLKIEENQPGPGVEPEVGITFDFADPIVAFGIYVTGADPAVQGAVSVRFDDGEPRFVSLDGPSGGSTQFWGITLPQGRSIRSVTVLVTPEAGINGDAIGIDDVRWVAAPEPRMWVLLAAAGLALGRRRR
jgi:hypothetical protein